MIAHTFDEAFTLVRNLVEDFRRNEAQFLASGYGETAVREVFINRFWMALGWDVTHETQKNPYECEVTVEKNVNVEGRGKRADYSFAVAPNYRDVRFFVEAKKPSRQIDNAQDYFQTMRYGWHARTPVAVLTDFEQFRVLDCRHKPDVETALTYGALEKFYYADYADEEKFRRLYHLFSRADVGAGSLEAYVAALAKPGARGAKQRALFAKGAYQSIDESFLRDLDSYRERLARAFKESNPQLDGAQLTEATQRTLDRLVFMRFLEDKLIETEELVEGFAHARAPWAEFVAASRRLNAVYNGIIFREHWMDAPAFRMEGEEFAGVCAELSHVRSAYDFNLLPVHILGSIYERFLGKTIEVGARGGASVVEKPEVRKAGGVYYTPEYIVRYIVDGTVGEIIRGKTPEQIRPLRFADISCGSGSFLLGVYDLLLRYHAEYYNRNKRTRAEGLKAGCTEAEDGTLRLSLLQKRTILLNNIYGVDVDAQAVEVAQLSLYLKLLEEETTASAHAHQLSFREALLPSLNKNVVGGNSLVDFDIHSGHLFEPEDERRLNPMSFKQEFPHVMRDGGFDALVGNPPYVLLQTLDQPYAFEYLADRYRSAKYKIDTYQVFIERGLQLTVQGGRIGFIVPNTFLRNKYAYELRRLILERSNVRLLRVFSYPVFKSASVDTAVIVLTRTDDPKADYPIEIVRSVNTHDVSIVEPQNQRAWVDHPEHHFALGGGDNAGKLISRIQAASILLGSFATAYFGIQTYDRSRYVRTFRANRHFKPVVDGGHINRYQLSPGSEFVDFRPEAIKSGGKQFVYEKQRIGVRQIGQAPVATILPAGIYTLNTVYNIFFTQPTKYSLEFILGITASKLIRWYWKQMFFDEKATFPKIKKEALLAIPVSQLNFSQEEGQRGHDRMVTLVEGMLAAKRQLAGAGTEAERNLYERKCANLDAQIDALVYELYGLNEQELELVEAG